MGMFQKALSGKIGKTLINLEFPTKENHPEQKELLILRNSALNDDEALLFYYSENPRQLQD